MNKNKLSNPVRLIAFFLTAVLLICTFGFTVDGWNLNFGPDSQPPSAISPEPTPDSTVEKETQKPDNNPEQNPGTPEVPEIKYYDRITGLECSQEVASKAHLAFVMNSGLPSYGLAAADMLCEIPTENGDTRYIAFVSEIDNLWKIGSITPTRGYIDNLINYFGGICVSNSNDDSMKYSSCDLTGRYLDLSVGGEFQYTEFTDNVYTNRDLLLSGITNSGIDRTSVQSPTLPYNFVLTDGEKIKYGECGASVISVRHSEKSTTELIYNETTGKYTLYKNDSQKLDAINNKTVEFTNCFVLFADSVTYDNSSCSQMIMDTVGGGVGYYFSEGGVLKINWVGGNDGSFTFYLESGEKLTVNRGKSYIGFMKSSRPENLSYE